MVSTLVSFVLLFLSPLTTLATEDKKGPPPFFLQDSTDGMCLAGEEFKRCAIDTLFYVVGSPGSYRIHKRPVEDTSKNDSSSGEDDESISDNDLCIAKKSCAPSDVPKILPAKLTKCTHCGAKYWNILGDASTGYVLSENDGETCLFRESNGNRALTAPCESTEIQYTPLQLQFATPKDIELMSSPGARLIAAAADGDKKLVQSLLTKDKIDANSRDWDDLTALIPASSAGHIDVVKVLLDANADVTLGDKDGITPLMEASIMGHLDIVNLLIDAGAEVDAKASSGVTALWLATGEGKADVVEALLNKHADPNNARSDGITALMTSSANGHADSVSILLQNGADATAVDQEGLTPLMNAAESGNIDILKALTESVEESKRKEYVDALSETGFTALIVASAHGHADAIKYLLSEASATVDFMHESGVTALMYAAAGGHSEATQILLDNGADVNILHSNGGSALLEASTAGAKDALKVLIDAGAKVDIVDKDGVTPIMSAASQGHLDCVKILLENLEKSKSSSDFVDYINLLSHSGGSAVMFAAGGGHPAETQLLMDKGAEVNAIAQATPEYLESLAEAIEAGTAPEDQEPHVDGVTAIHVAAQGGHLECVKILLNGNANPSIEDNEKRSPLLLAVKGNFGEVATELVKAGADPNTLYVDEDGLNHNLLMDAIIVENEVFSLLLIEKGVDIYYEDDHKVSTLLQAAHRGMDAVVKALLSAHNSNENKKDGFVDLPSDEGITPLIAASSEGHSVVVPLLIEAGANVNAVDKDGTSALMAAAARGHIDPVQTLLDSKADTNAQNIDGHTALMFAYNGKNQVETLWERYNQFVAEAKITAGEEEGAKEEVDDGETGPIIQESLEKHQALVNLLVQNGADATLKDKEGRTASDFDFHPEVDPDVLKQEEEAVKRMDQSKNEL